MVYDPKRRYKGMRVKISQEGLERMGGGVHCRAKASNADKRGTISLHSGKNEARQARVKSAAAELARLETTNMHTTETLNCYFVHNGDYRGEVRIIQKDPASDTREEITVDFADLVAFVGQAVQAQQISRLEQEDPYTTLGLSKPTT